MVWFATNENAKKPLTLIERNKRLTLECPMYIQFLFYLQAH